MPDRTSTDGGYDDGYRACPCFWGRDPGSLVKKLDETGVDFRGLSVLDVGCGEGKNAAYLAERGAVVRAIDVSSFAIQNAVAAWPRQYGVSWEVADIRGISLPTQAYDLVVAYGLMHCFSSEEEIRDIVLRLQTATRPAGYHILCAFNSRHQDLVAHPHFRPCLANHSFYVQLYSNWALLSVSDTDLKETHPHNAIPHAHSLTRILARNVGTNEHTD